MELTVHRINMTDAQLLTRFVRDKDRDALSEIVRRHERLVWSVCRRLLRNPTDIEDAFQITFLTLTANASKIRKRKSLSNWLFGVARRTSLNIRKQRASILIEDTSELIASEEDQSRSELLAIRKQNEIDLVDQQLNALPRKHRTPLIMKYFSGLSAQQIADQMNLTVSAVEGRLRRARTQLRMSLRRVGFETGAIDESPSCSSSVLGAILLLDFVSKPARVSATTANCIATSIGSVTSGVTSISYGAKLMICKTFCVMSIGAMMSAALMLHPSPSDSNAIVFNAAEVRSIQSGDMISVQQTADGNCCCDLCESICDCCDETCPGVKILSAAKNHLVEAHSMVGKSVHEIALWIHGSSD